VRRAVRPDEGDDSGREVLTGRQVKAAAVDVSVAASVDDKLVARGVISTLNEAGDPIDEAVLTLQDSGDVEADLRDLARRQLAAVIQPKLMQLRRLVIGEVARFPDLGRIFYERGQGRTIPALAAALERLAAHGLLELEDAQLAATHFNWLIMSAPVNRAMLLGDDRPLTEAELDRYAEGGVRVFIAAYGQG
jgi:TetR/AcrR family transcriptional regulator, mexJK operon transcriptional repressor